MYKVIVADDETFALKHLCGMLDWKNYGFELVGTFSNGQSVYEFLENNHVDLIITDIEMPIKSGLELAKDCYKFYPNTYFIFISTYRNFEYAQEATKYNTIDYVTKPFNISTLETALRQAVKKLSSIGNNMFSNSKTLSVQQYFFSNILCSSPSKSKSLVSELEKIGLSEDMLLNECALLNIHFKDFQLYLDSSWKYGTERFYNAMFFVLPEDKNIFCSLIKHSFDTVQFVCIARNDTTSFKEYTEDYIKKFTCNLLTLLNIKCSNIDITYHASIFDINSGKMHFDKDSSNKALIEKSKAYIKEHYSENISLKNVAEHVSLSSVYFGAFFKQQTGENFNNYLRNIRLEQAMDYLINTDIPIVNICEMVGYKNTTYFYDLIKLRTGMTPNEYRSYHCKKENSNE